MSPLLAWNSPKTIFIDYRAALAAICTLGVILFLGYVKGDAKEQERFSGFFAFTVPTLKYGDPFPDFRLPDTVGRVWTKSDCAGKWTLFVIGSVSCISCRQEMENLTDMPQRNPGCQVIGMLSGAPIFGNLSTMCVKLHQQLKLNFPLLSDEGARVIGRVVDDNPRLPFCVLVDPQGHLRYVDTGYRIGEVQTNVAQIMGAGTVSVPVKPPAFPIDGTLMEGMGVIDFRDVIKKGWTVVTFAKYGCGRCNDRLNAIARFRFDNLNTRCYIIMESPEDVKKEEKLTSQLPIHCVWSPNLSKKFGGNIRVPTTYIFYNGALAQSEMQGNIDTSIWNVLGAVQDHRLIVRS